jgi:pyruvate dehydrogenase E2 component (dihydrolipoamide acetyltransferase)
VFGEKGEKVDVDALVGAQKSGKGSDKSSDKANVVDLPSAKAGAKKEVAKTAAAQPAAPAPAHRGASAAPAARAAATPAAPAAGGERVKASPLAKKIAAQHGVDVGAIAGSGPNGRIVMRDVEAAVAGGDGRGGAAAPLRAYQPARPFSQGAAPEDQVLPLTMMRKTIAKRLLAGKNEAPHFYLTVSANMGRMLEWRQRLNDEAAQAAKGGQEIPKVSVNDLVIMAAARALRRHPVVNSSWQGETVLQHGGVHVAVAVALPEGLVTPVIRDADTLGVRDIAHASRELAGKAKAGKLANDDYAGGTFTISNLGMFGVEEFTAIINPPQAAILAVGATQALPWVDAKGNLVAQQRMKMTMSCDHRVVDGATGAQFLQTLVGFLEDPLLMMS